MSIANLKIIFVKKQKQTRKRPNSRPGRDIIRVRRVIHLMIRVR